MAELDNGDKGILDWPDRVASGGSKLLRDNFRALVIVAAFAWLAIEAGFIDSPDIGIGVPLWARVFGVFATVFVVIGQWLASKYLSQPEPDWNYIVEVNLSNPILFRIKKVTDAVLEDFTVHCGTFGNPDGTKIYYCRWWNHDIENPHALCTWDEVHSDAELLAMPGSSILDEVHSIRSSYEETIYRADFIESHFPIIVRRLQSEKAKSLNDALEGHIAPDIGKGSGTIDNVITDVLPDEVLPEHFRERLDQADELGVGHTTDVVDDTDDPTDTDPAEPGTPELPGETGDGQTDAAVATDGGDDADE